MIFVFSQEVVKVSINIFVLQILFVLLKRGLFLPLELHLDIIVKCKSIFLFQTASKLGGLGLIVSSSFVFIASFVILGQQLFKGLCHVFFDVSFLFPVERILNSILCPFFHV